jgi:hypothetical protein
MTGYLHHRHAPSSLSDDDEMNSCRWQLSQPTSSIVPLLSRSASATLLLGDGRRLRWLCEPVVHCSVSISSGRRAISSARRRASAALSSESSIRPEARLKTKDSGKPLPSLMRKPSQVASTVMLGQIPGPKVSQDRSTYE